MRCGKYREGVILNESRMKMAVFMEDRKIQLTEWEGPDGCISTKRVAVEKMQVGLCYRTKPAGEWDSGWRFIAGDESHEYMDQPENSGIYKLITIVSIDPDVLPLLKAPCGSAFERDEKGIFHQVDDWHLE